MERSAGVLAAQGSVIAVSNAVTLSRGLTPEMIAAGAKASGQHQRVLLEGSHLLFGWEEQPRIDKEIAIDRYVQGLTLRAAT